GTFTGREVVAFRFGHRPDRFELFARERLGGVRRFFRRVQFREDLFLSFLVYLAFAPDHTVASHGDLTGPFGGLALPVDDVLFFFFAFTGVRNPEPVRADGAFREVGVHVLGRHERYHGGDVAVVHTDGPDPQFPDSSFRAFHRFVIRRRFLLHRRVEERRPFHVFADVCRPLIRQRRPPSFGARTRGRPGVRIGRREIGGFRAVVFRFRGSWRADARRRASGRHGSFARGPSPRKLQDLCVQGGLGKVECGLA